MDRARRQAYLNALGIQAWTRRDPATDAGPALPAAPDVDLPDSTPPPPAPAGGGFPSDMLRAALRGEAPATARAAPAKAQPRPKPVDRIAAAVLAASPAAAAPRARDVGDLGWPELADAVSGCRECALHQSRTQTVFGVGSHAAQLMIVGEAPGADEDRLGEPFVGRAGQLLDAMLHAIGLDRQQVYIANILKCRPPGNRNPEAEEVAACQGYLERQIALLQPKLILSVGAISAHNLLGTDLPVGKLRGRLHHHASGVPVAVTYHPAYLLRRPEEKAKAWADLQQVMRTLRG